MELKLRQIDLNLLFLQVLNYASLIKSTCLEICAFPEFNFFHNFSFFLPKC
jgi:hypothetical protein